MRPLAVLMVGALALPACSDGKDGGAADPTVPTAASTTATSAVPDVSVIPEKIDEAYLNAVLVALDEVDGQATRIIVATKRFPPEAADLLNSIYSDEAFDLEAEVWFDSIARDPELKGIRPNPGNRKTIVERLISASPSCVWMAVKRDYSARNFNPGPDRIEYVALQILDRSNDAQRRNTTPWMITTDGYRQDGTEPSNPCRPE